MKRIILATLAATAGAAIFLSMSAAQLPLASGYDSSAPIDVSADHSEVQSNSNRLIYLGNVIIKQSSLTIHAARATVNYTMANNSPHVDRVDAEGGVQMTKGDQSARGGFAIYDANRKIITMFNGVTVAQGANHASGARLVFDLNSNHLVMDGGAFGGVKSGVAGSPQRGRVTGHFIMPDKK